MAAGYNKVHLLVHSIFIGFPENNSNYFYYPNYHNYFDIIKI